MAGIPMPVMLSQGASLVAPQILTPVGRGCGKWRALTSSDSGDGEPVPKTGKKEWDPNWNHIEMMALVRAKRHEFLEELDTKDPRELMSNEMMKWERVSLFVNRADGISCFRSAEVCKYKWQQLLPNYKKASDLHKGTRTNSMLYFNLNFAKRRDQVLPKDFDAFV